jgi:hypothetical protein
VVPVRISALRFSAAIRPSMPSFLFSWGIRALRQLFASDDGAISSPPAPYHLSAMVYVGTKPVKFAADSLLEGSGFELLVPLGHLPQTRPSTSPDRAIHRHRVMSA